MIWIGSAAGAVSKEGEDLRVITGRRVRLHRVPQPPNCRAEVVRGARDGDGLAWNFSIPANTVATVYVPTKDAANVTEAGKPMANAEGVKFLRMEGGSAVYEAGSGAYSIMAH